MSKQNFQEEQFSSRETNEKHHLGMKVDTVRHGIKVAKKLPAM